MITEKINKGIALVCFLLLSGGVSAQYPSSGEQVNYNSTELTNEVVKTISMGGCVTTPCDDYYKKVSLVIDFSLADDYADITSFGSVISAEVDVIITANKCSFLGQPPYTLTKRLEIDTDNPRQVFQLDFTSVYLSLDDIEVTVDNYVVPVGYESSVNLSVGYEGDFLFPSAGKTVTATSVVNSDPMTNSTREFNWAVDCGNFAMYEFQLLKLENNSLTNAQTNNPSIVTADVDWSKALSIHTYSWEKALRLTLTDGTGYYTWRVRGIGNAYKGDESNPENWGTWSAHIADGLTNINPATYTGLAHTFYYGQFNEDKNWVYSRVFIEGEQSYEQGVKVGEQIGFANGLLQGQQSQSILNTNHQVLATENVQDYSGRASLSSISAPVYGQNSLEFKEEFFLSATDGTAYDAADFDRNINYQEPTAVQLSGVNNGFGYYSDFNTTETYVPSAADPADATIGYPFTRTNFYNDGRVKESSGVGFDHRLKNDGTVARTTKVYYESVANDELLRVLGNEAPDAGSVHKMVTIDPDKTVHMSYINKAGQTLFTCLSLPATDDYALIDLDSQADAIYQVNETVDPFIKTDATVMERTKNLLLPTSTSLEINYGIVTNLLQDACASFCSSCDYEFSVEVIDVEANTSLYSYTEPINPTTACTSESLPYTYSLTLAAGKYRVVQRLIADNTVAGTLNTQLEEHSNTLEQTLTDQILGDSVNTSAELYQIMTHIDNNDLIALYSYLEGHPNATLVTLPDGDEYYDFDVYLGNATPCTTLNIPVVECEDAQCPTSATEFTALLSDFGYGIDILTYEYAQGLNHTYTSDEFIGLINNMVADGYDYCKLWVCWRGILMNHQNSLDLEAALNNTSEGATYTYNPINTFLDCARGSQYPAGNYPLIAGTELPGSSGGGVGYIWNAHTHFYYTSGTYVDCIYAYDSIGNPGHLVNTSDWSTNTNLEMQSFYNCINHIDLSGSAANQLNNINGSIEDGCEQACEQKRSLFRNKLLNLYHSQGAVIEGDSYVYVPLTIAGSIEYVPDLNNPLADPAAFDYSLAEIECAVDVLVENCKGNCTVSDPMTAAEEQNIQNVLTGSFEISLPNVLGSCEGDQLSNSATVGNFLFSWDQVENDETVHSAATESALIDIDKDGQGCIALLEGNKITKYNSAGLPLWSKVFSTEISDRTIHSIKTIQGGYLISTSNFQVARLDGTGNVVWINSYNAQVSSSGTESTSSVEVNENGDVFILWYLANGSTYYDVLLKMDLYGNFDWAYEYNASNGSDFRKAVLAPMEDGVVIGSANGEEVYKVGGTGTLAWNADPGFSTALENIRSIQQTADNDWTLTGNKSGNAEVYTVHADGSVANAGVPLTISGEEGYDVAPTYDDDFVVVTQKSIAGYDIQFQVTKVTGGVIDWTEDFGCRNEEYNPMILSQTDGDFILAGTSTAGSTDATGFKHETTTIDDIWEAWYVKFRYHNDVCHPVDFCINWIPFDPDLDFGDEPTAFEFMPCEEVESNYLRSTILNQVSAYIQQKKWWLESTYETQCLIPENIEDELRLTYNLAAYHYMLYYYDRAGNLVKTVPPQGVELQDLTNSGVQNRTIIPKHTLVTDYQYNSLGQMTRSHTPDGGETDYYYDALSRMRFSQNAYQLANGSYAYIKYDALGRAIESGESTLDAAGQAFLLNAEDPSYPASATSDWTKTVYNSAFSGVTYKGQEQRFLRNRISYVYNEQGAYTYYSYDPHGNVEWVVQEIPGFDRFTIAYEYDILSGNVLMVRYNDDSENNPDKFYHRYKYDADNRLVTAETSVDGVIWDKEQENEYSSIGQMHRKLTGQDNVQGTDYVYTIKGWLKGINHSSLSTEKDPGQDNFGNTVAADAFGMVLSYYEGDYRRNSGIGTAYTNADEHYLAGTDNLYGGNIAAWASRIPDRTTQGVTDIEHAGNIAGFKYRYDELHRIKNADFFTVDANASGALWTGSPDYHTEYSFDANGNLTNIQRNAHSNVASGLLMDDLEYDYNHLSGGTAITPTAANYENFNNQLNMVEDLPDATGIDDLAGAHSYGYDEIGRLTTDLEEDISQIQWTPFQKVAAIIKVTGEEIRFEYDALHNRIAKIFIHPSDVEQNETTYYVRDAQGNCMAVYTKNTVDVSGDYHSVFKLKEQTLFGSDRVGLLSPRNVVVKELDELGEEVNFTAYDKKTELENWNLSVQNEVQIGSWNLPVITEMNYNSSTQAASNNTFTGGFGWAGTNNAVLEDELGNLMLSVATHRAYNGVNNVSIVRNANGNMVAGSQYIDAAWNGQSIFVKQPGSDDYFLITVNPSGQLKAHRIFVNGVGALEVSDMVTTIPGTYAQGLGVVDDRSGDFGTQVLAIRKGVGISKLVSIEVNYSGDPSGDFGNPIERRGFDYEIVSGNITLSPGGERIAVATEETIVFNTSWFSITFPRTQIYNNDYTDYETVTTATVRDVGNFARSTDIAYTPSGDNLFYTQRKWLGNGTYRWNLAVTASSHAPENGALRRGENDQIYILENRAFDANNNIVRISTPDGTPTASIQSILPSVTYVNYLKADIPLQPHVIRGDDANVFTRHIGDKLYELKDHLGNVRTVVTDRKLYDGADYTADIVSISDYFPYGMQLPGRHQSSDVYRYGFQGQEKDDEIKGEGNSVNYKYRMHDPRVGRFFAVDPLAAKYPHYTPYQFSGNKVIDHIELEGLEEEKPAYKFSANFGAQGILTVTGIPFVESRLLNVYATGSMSANQPIKFQFGLTELGGNAVRELSGHGVSKWAWNARARNRLHIAGGGHVNGMTDFSVMGRISMPYPLGSLDFSANSFWDRNGSPTVQYGMFPPFTGKFGKFWTLEQIQGVVGTFDNERLLMSQYIGPIGTDIAEVYTGWKDIAKQFEKPLKKLGYPRLGSVVRSHILENGVNRLWKDESVHYTFDVNSDFIRIQKWKMTYITTEIVGFNVSDWSLEEIIGTLPFQMSGQVNFYMYSTESMLKKEIKFEFKDLKDIPQ